MAEPESAVGMGSPLEGGVGGCYSSPGSAGVPHANKILVLGVGNPFRRDDGIGPAVISHLKSEWRFTDSKVDLLDGGIDGLSLIDCIEGYEKVLVVDAVDMGAVPGEVRMFSPEEAKLTIKADTLSTHGFGLAEVIALMEKLEMKPDMHIIGIQAKDVNFGEGMSPEVSSKIEEILKLIKEHL
jgi:hydrogenase maturation protease